MAASGGASWAANETASAAGTGAAAGSEGGAWGSTTYEGDGAATGGGLNGTKDLTPEEYLTIMLGPRQVTKEKKRKKL